MTKVLVTNITGPEGPQGPPGADGADGADGTPVALNDLTDVNTAGAIDGKVLGRVGGIWLPVDGSTGGGGGGGGTTVIYTSSLKPDLSGPNDSDFNRQATNLPTGWSWLAQGNATFAEGYSQASVGAEGAFNYIRGIKRAMADPFDQVTFKFSMVAGGDGADDCLFFLRNSTTGKIFSFSLRGANSARFQKFNNESSFVSEVSTALAAPINEGYATIQKLGTDNWLFRVGTHPQDTVPTYGGLDVDSWLGTIDEIGFGLLMESGGPNQISVDWMKFGPVGAPVGGPAQSADGVYPAASYATGGSIDGTGRRLGSDVTFDFPDLGSDNATVTFSLLVMPSGYWDITYILDGVSHTNNYSGWFTGYTVELGPLSAGPHTLVINGSAGASNDMIVYELDVTGDVSDPAVDPVTVELADHETRITTLETSTGGGSGGGSTPGRSLQFVDATHSSGHISLPITNGGSIDPTHWATVGPQATFTDVEVGDVVTTSVDVNYLAAGNNVVMDVEVWKDEARVRTAAPGSSYGTASLMYNANEQTKRSATVHFQVQSDDVAADGSFTIRLVYQADGSGVSLSGVVDAPVTFQAVLIPGTVGGSGGTASLVVTKKSLGNVFSDVITTTTLVDGNRAPGSYTIVAGGTLTVDMGAETAFEDITWVLYWGDGRTYQDVRLEGSHDNSTWTDIRPAADFQPFTTGADGLVIPVNASWRYLRFTTNGSDSYPASNEWVEIYAPLGVVTDVSLVDGGTLVEVRGDSDWTEVTLGNGWVNGDPAVFQTPAYRKDALGFVHFTGIVKDGTNGVAFTLPEGYRPDRTWNKTIGTRYVHILPDGTVSLGGDGVVWINLDTVIFLAAGETGQVKLPIGSTGSSGTPVFLGEAVVDDVVQTSFNVTSATFVPLHTDLHKDVMIPANGSIDVEFLGYNDVDAQPTLLALAIAVDGVMVPDSDTIVMRDSLGSLTNATWHLTGLNPGSANVSILAQRAYGSGNVRVYYGGGNGPLTLRVRDGLPISGGGDFSYCGVRVHTSASQAFTGGWETVEFDTEDFDTDGFHDTSVNPSRFTVPVGKAGYYDLVATVSYQTNGSGSRFVCWLINGTTREAVNALPALSGSFRTRAATGPFPIYLDEGDYVEVQGYQDSGSSLEIGDTTAAGSGTETWASVTRRGS